MQGEHEDAAATATQTCSRLASLVAAVHTHMAVQRLGPAVQREVEPLLGSPTQLVSRLLHL
jgi:hypothetical protein